MEKVTLINDGGYVGMENVRFPVVVSVSDSNSRAVSISPQEMERIGCDMSKFGGADGWWFVKSEHCVVMANDMNRERFEELAKLKGMDVTRANRRITFVNLEVIEAGEYMSSMTEAAWWGWQEAMKEKGDE